MIECNQIATIAADLQAKFEKCKKLSAADMDLLVDLIIAVDNCSDSSIAQNNLVKSIDVGLVDDESTLANVINTGMEFTVEDTEICIISRQDSDDNTYKYILKTGKGDYGTGNTQIQLTDLESIASAGGGGLIQGLQSVLDTGNFANDGSNTSILIDLVNKIFEFSAENTSGTGSLYGIESKDDRNRIYRSAKKVGPTIIGEIGVETEDGYPYLKKYSTDGGGSSEFRIQTVIPDNFDFSILTPRPTITQDTELYSPISVNGEIADSNGNIIVPIETAQELHTSSIIVTSRDVQATDKEGLNVSTANSDVTITIVDNATVNFTIGTLLLYKRTGSGNVIITGGPGVTMPTYQTYTVNDTIAIRKIEVNTWEFINPPKDISSGIQDLEDVIVQDPVATSIPVFVNGIKSDETQNEWFKLNKTSLAIGDIGPDFNGQWYNVLSFNNDDVDGFYTFSAYVSNPADNWDGNASNYYMSENTIQLINTTGINGSNIEGRLEIANGLFKITQRHDNIYSYFEFEPGTVQGHYYRIPSNPNSTAVNYLGTHVNGVPFGSDGNVVVTSTPVDLDDVTTVGNRTTNSIWVDGGNDDSFVGLMVEESNVGMIAIGNGTPGKCLLTNPNTTIDRELQIPDGDGVIPVNFTDGTNTVTADVNGLVPLQDLSFSGGSSTPQTLSIIGQDLTISGGNTVTLPSGGSSTALATTYDNSDSTLTGTNLKDTTDELDSKFEAFASDGIKGYQTFAELPAVTTADNGLRAKVVNDADDSLDGTYSVALGVWVQDDKLLANERAIIDVQQIDGYNLYDPSLVVNGFYYSASNQTTKLANASAGTFTFPVIAGENYYIKHIGTLRGYALLDINSDVIQVISGANEYQIKIPVGCEFVSINARYANVVHTDVIIVKSEYDIGDKVNDTFTAGVYGEYDNGRSFLEKYKNELKGRSVAPDSYLKNVDLVADVFPTAQWAASTVLNDIAFKNTGHYSITKVSDVPIYGTGLRYMTTFPWHPTTRHEYGFKFDKQFLIEKGFKTGDEIKFGYWLKFDNPLELPVRETSVMATTAFSSAITSTRVFIDDGWTWVEFTPLIFDSSLDVYVNNKIYAIATEGTAIESFVITGLTLLNKSENVWLGYEENYDTILEQEVASALSGGISPQIEEVLLNNPSFQDLLNTQHYGAYMTDFRMQLRTMIDFWGKPASEVKIVFLADSILFGSSGAASIFAQWLLNEFGIPLENTNLNSCWGGYSANDYLRTVESSVIYAGADLVVISEAGGQNKLEQMIQLIRSKSSADIVIGTWSKYTDDPAYETVGQYNQMRDMAHMYGCELWDISALLSRAIADNDYLQYYNGNLHLSLTGSQKIADDLKLRIKNDRFYNEYNKGTTKQKIVQVSPDFNIPLNGITYSGSWESSNTVLTSTTVGDYIEIPFDGVGIEMLFNSNNTDHTILLDGVSPSAYVSSGRYLEYCTQIIDKVSTADAWQFHRLFKASVTAPFLLEAEDSLEFEITIDAITRDGGGLVTSMDYTLKVNDGTWTTLGTGDIDTDSSFTVRGTGEVTIPSHVFGIPNFLEMPNGDPNEPASGYVFTVGDTMTFYAKKTWTDTFNSNDLLLSIKGLERGSHTLRVTKGTGTTELKYINIFK